MTKTIQVAIYTHRHGDDVGAFQTVVGAEEWRQTIAADFWADEVDDTAMPTDPKLAADEYFEIMGSRASKGEFFEVRPVELEG